MDEGNIEYVFKDAPDEHYLPTDEEMAEMNMSKMNVALTDDEEEEIVGRVQGLEYEVSEMKKSQQAMHNDMRKMMQSVAEMSTLIKDSRSNLKSLGRPRDEDDRSVISELSNGSTTLRNLYNTGKICFVDTQANHGWYIVYKKKEHLKTMYTYRDNDLKRLTTTQRRTMKDDIEQEEVYGKTY